MIQHLSVKNYALIKELELDFQSGFTSITGETGAGKSILLGALGLLLGERADLSAIPNKEEKCIIEGHFAINGLSLESLFEENNWDFEINTVVRREWLPNGKSRAFVNDSPVPVGELKLLGEQLFEIHSQHSTLQILENIEQIKALDAFAGVLPELKSYQLKFQTVKKLETQLQQKRKQVEQNQKEADFQQFLLEELQQFQPIKGEEIEIEQQIRVLSNAADIASAFAKAAYLLSDSEQSVIIQFNNIKQEIKHFGSISSELQSFIDRIDSLALETKDLGREFDAQSQKTHTDPAQLAELEQRYNQLQVLLRKHHVNTAAELIAIQEQLSGNFQQNSELEAEIAKLESEINQIWTQVLEEGAIISEKRKACIPSFIELIQKDLQGLEIPYATLQIEISNTEPHKFGLDEIQYLFSANKGMPLLSLNKAASGGELSRLNFCIRNIIAEKLSLPTLIYDEADTGVSGEVASKLGKMMKKHGEKQQIIAITHLPQVAASGHQQLFVYKSNDTATTETKVRQLNDADRIVELATMLSGKNPSEAAIANAKALLQQASVIS